MKQFSVFIFLLLTGCKIGGPEDLPARNLGFDAFGRYWYQGKAEVNSYALEQFRYGEKREAEAVLVFVTEDLSREKQVKLDVPEKAGKDAQKILKLNFTKKFITGVYPYSMLLSTFLPVYDSVPAVKIAASVQDWCGQTYAQLNFRNGAYQAERHSFFETEGDQELTLKARAEDELWTLLRLNPNQLPLGKQNLIPGLLDLRFTHQPFKTYQATTSLQKTSAALAGFRAEKLQTLEVTYQD